jgi:tRNA-2-methylthio-N6-dimethylallyladenosine synthase
MRDNVSKKEKVRRKKYLNEILKKTSFENNKKYVGKTIDVLITKTNFHKSKNESSLITYFGRTRTMKNVKIISGRKNLVGKIVKVEIIKANVWNLEGRLK